MSFLDNLENSLKNLESQDERDPSERQRRDDDRARALASAPWAERLRSSEYSKKLFDEAAAAGHRLRTKVYMVWLDTTLRLEARGRRLELRPTPDGIVCEMIEPDGAGQSKPVDLNGDPERLIEDWLG
jgi:hypothetical protein